jgi:hypothetical protein
VSLVQQNIHASSQTNVTRKRCGHSCSSAQRDASTSSSDSGMYNRLVLLNLTLRSRVCKHPNTYGDRVLINRNGSPVAESRREQMVWLGPRMLTATLENPGEGREQF